MTFSSNTIAAIIKGLIKKAIWANARTHLHTAGNLRASGRPEEAKTHIQYAIDSLQKLNDPDAASLIADLRQLLA
jgi:hypothetical protein